MVAWRIFFALAVTFGLVPTATNAADCAPGALGTSRVLTIEAKTMPRVGKPFASTLPLDSHEVILTFDDGPRSTTTAQVLDALAQQCVRAIFFVIGENAVAHPELLRRERADGHTIGYHTWSHPLLDRVPPSVGEANIDHGIDAVHGRPLCGLVEAIRPTTPIKPLSQASDCDPVFAVGATLIRLRLRSLDDMIYYVGELLRTDSTSGGAGGVRPGTLTPAARW